MKLKYELVYFLGEVSTIGWSFYDFSNQLTMHMLTVKSNHCIIIYNVTNVFFCPIVNYSVYVYLSVHHHIHHDI